jgi:PAS domain S-box-containing protein
VTETSSSDAKFDRIFDLSKVVDRSESLKLFCQALVEAITAHVIVLDVDGNQVLTGGYSEHREYNPFLLVSDSDSVNYFFFLESIKGSLAVEANKLLNGIQQVINSELSIYRCEYCFENNHSPTWYVARVSSFEFDNQTFVAVAYFNITEKKVVEAKLLESEKQYRNLVETSNDLIWEVDKEGKWLFLNRRATINIYGYTPEEMLGRPFFEFTDRNLIDRDLKTFETIKSGVAQFRYTTTHYKKDGTPVILSFNAIPNYDEFGELTGAIGTATDITSIKKADVIVKKQQAAIEASIDGIAILNDDGEFIYMNDAHAKMYGYDSANEFIGQKWTMLYNKKWQDYFTDIFTTVWPKDREWRGEAEGLKKDGTPLYSEVSLTAINEGGFICICRNISRRKKSEEILRQSEERYRSFAANAPIGIWHLDRDGITTYLNPVMSQMLELDESVGLETLTFRQFVAPEYLEKVNEQVEKRKSRITSSYEIDLIGVKGKRVSVVVVGAPQFSANNELIGYIKTILDVTEKKRFENDKLNLEIQRRQLQKLESLGVLAGGIAHDFNNLLMGVLGNAELALMEIGNSALDRLAITVRERVFQIQIAARHAAELTNQLLAYSGGGRFSPQVMDLGEIVKETSSLIKSIISKKAEICCDFSSLRLPVEVDATQVKQVVMNLITNASDSLENKAGTIRIVTGQCKLSTTSIPGLLDVFEITEGEYVFLRIVDTGSGIPKHMIQKMFDPFFSTKFTGRGLGLSAVIGIVRSHQGAISVESEVGVGTTFTVYFPRSDKEATSNISEAVTSSKYMKGSGLVFVVDDERIVRDTTREILERSGYDVLLAKDGSEAVSIFRNRCEEIKAVVLDMTMPRMDGTETLRELKKIKSEVPVILSSGYHQGNEDQESNRAASGFIQKPYGPKILLEKLKEVAP